MLRRSFLASAAAAAARTNGFRIAVFRADITPPAGSPIYTGTARSIVDPLEARGIVLHGGTRPIVIAALDWCEIRNRSYDRWRSQLAAAANTTARHVLVSCVHQHDAPYTDTEAQELLNHAGSPHILCDPEFEQASIRKVAEAIRRAPMQRVNSMGVGHSVVESVASNRRYVRPDGSVSFGRTSATRDSAIRNQPEGLVDPVLRTISFWNDSQAVAAIHAYSTHPMSYYGQRDVSADFPGISRRKMQAETPDIFHIYCSGASGDTMAGRYNDGDPRNRNLLASRLHAAMAAALSSTKRSPLTRVSFRNAPVTFEARKDKGYALEDMKRVLTASNAPRRERLDAALGMSWLRRLAKRRPIDLPAVHLDAAAIVLLPAESFVQYQLWAQQVDPQRPVMTLGYGECAPGYIPTNSAVAEGYSDHYSWIDFRTCEHALRNAINTALKRID